jgi:hypothetical protein
MRARKALEALFSESVIVTIAFLVGVAAIPAGVALIAGLGAGLVVFGLLDLAAVVLYAKGRL